MDLVFNIFRQMSSGLSLFICSLCLVIFCIIYILLHFTFSSEQMENDKFHKKIVAISFIFMILIEHSVFAMITKIFF